MSLARRLELRLEQLVDGLSAAIFRGGMHPVELAGRVVRQADLLVREGAVGPEIPNHFEIRINPKDFADGVDGQALDRELTRTLVETAAERGWRTGGPVAVHVGTDPAVGVGAIACETRSQPGPGRTWAQLIDAADGTPHPLDDNRIVIGRSSSADVTIGNPEVSRIHALLFRRRGRVWVADLGSSNGTTVNGTHVQSEPHPVHAGDLISIGGATLALRFV